MEKQQIKSEKLALMARFKSSGQTVAAFCKKENISPNTFFYWRKKLSKNESAEKVGFIPLQKASESFFLGFAEVIFPSGARIVFHRPVPFSELKQLMV
jgi:hypothetical protein